MVTQKLTARDWVTPEQAAAANQMLAELRGYKIPPDWLRCAAEHVAKYVAEWDDERATADDILACWRAGTGPYQPGSLGVREHP